jgi:hypothetical protein
LGGSSAVTAVVREDKNMSILTAPFLEAIRSMPDDRRIAMRDDVRRATGIEHEDEIDEENVDAYERALLFFAPRYKLKEKPNNAT